MQIQNNNDDIIYHNYKLFNYLWRDVMPSLISIGHTKAIPIPKIFVDQAHLENQELQFKVVKEGLLISPIKSVRKSWKDYFEEKWTRNS